MGHQSFFETEKNPQTRMNTKKNVPDSKIRHIICAERVDLYYFLSGLLPYTAKVK